MADKSNHRGIVIRADASVSIGNGHVMRCLTLADAVTEARPRASGEITFVTRTLPGHLRDVIERRGYACHMLPVPSDPAAAASPDWSCVSPREDATETIDALSRASVRWATVVVDHYGLDATWERALRAHADAIIAVDDLADRPHDADVLLDQSAGHPEGAYDGLVPPGCERLLGPRFALLRPEFARLRRASLDRPIRADHGGRILIAAGGTDPGNLTERALQGLAGNDVRAAIDVVLGSAAPHLDAIRAWAEDAPHAISVHVDTGDMATLMAAADLAVGSCGMTAWERCSLGLPAVAVVDGDNQSGNAAALAAAGAAVVLGSVEELRPADLGRAAAALWSDVPRLETMRKAAAAMCDGEGASRVATAVSKYVQ